MLNDPSNYWHLIRWLAAAGAGVIGTIDFHDPTSGANSAGTPAAGQVLDIQSIVNGISTIKRHQSTIQAELVGDSGPARVINKVDNREAQGLQGAKIRRLHLHVG